MAKREKVSCGRVLAWVRVASVYRLLELLLRKITSEFNFRRLKSHRALIDKYCATVERVKAKPPPPEGIVTPLCERVKANQPSPEGRVTPLCGLYWGVLLERLSQLGIVSTIDIPSRFSVLTEGQGFKPAASPLHPNIGQKPPLPPPPPPMEGTGVATFEVLNCRT